MKQFTSNSNYLYIILFIVNFYWTTKTYFKWKYKIVDIYYEVEWIFTLARFYLIIKFHVLSVIKSSSVLEELPRYFFWFFLI